MSREVTQLLLYMFLHVSFGNFFLHQVNIPEPEIIRVREQIPHIDPLIKVIPLKLFLDMVPSASEDATRAMLG